MDFPIKQIENYLKLNKINEVFDALDSILLNFEDFENIKKILIIRRSEYNELIYEKRLGTIDHGAFRIAKNQILHTLIDILNEVQIYLKNRAFIINDDHSFYNELDEIEKRLKRKKVATNVTFIGESGIGKTSFITNLINYIQTNYSLNYKIDNSFVEGSSINSYNSLNVSDGDWEYSLSIFDENLNGSIPLTLNVFPVEVKRKIANDDVDNSEEIYKRYLIGVDYILIFIPYGDLNNKEIFNILQFLNNFNRLSAKVCVIISQWDKNKEDTSFLEYLYSNMRTTLGLIIEKNHHVLPLSFKSKDAIKSPIEWLLKEIKTTPNNALVSIASIRRLLH